MGTGKKGEGFGVGPIQKKTSFQEFLPPDDTVRFTVHVYLIPMHIFHFSSTSYPYRGPLNQETRAAHASLF